MAFRLKAAVAAALVAGAGAANALVVDFYAGTDLIATMETSLGTVFELDFVYAPSPGAFIDYIDLAGPGGVDVLGHAGHGTSKSRGKLSAVACLRSAETCKRIITSANTDVSLP